MLTASKSVGIDMSAIDPLYARSNANKIKSASIEANNQPLGLSSLQFDYGFDNRQQRLSNLTDRHLSVCDNNQYGREDRSSSPSINDKDYLSTNSFQAKAKKLLTLSPGTNSLKPSVSTSCLLTAEAESSSSGSGANGSNALICIPTRASLTHEWKKLKTPNKCRECNLLVYFNGRECSFCGFVAHKKCVTILVIKCSGQAVAGLANRSNRKQTTSHNNNNNNNTNQQRSSKSKTNNIQPIFGQPIRVDSFQVIDFLRRFIYEIDTRGLTSKGIYRVSSIKSKVDRLCNYYDQNLSSLVDLSSFHPNIIANALKMYLRQLPEPLLTHKLYNNFIEIAKKYPSNNNNQKQEQQQSDCASADSSTTLHKPHHRRPFSLSTHSTTISINNNPAYDPMLIVELREIIDLLPPINRELIGIIMRHLRRVADMSCENQMSALNLSIIFGPTLLNADNKSLAIVDNVHQARAIELMITWAEQIFPQFANYESRATIGLDLSEKYFNELKQQESPIFTIEQQQTITNRGDLNNRFNYEITTTAQQPATKTRQDLRESRRQFFTQPTPTTSSATNTNVQTNYKQQYPPPLPLPDKISPLKPVCSSASKVLPTKQLQQVGDTDLKKSLVTIVSVPVIKHTDKKHCKI